MGSVTYQYFDLLVYSDCIKFGPHLLRNAAISDEFRHGRSPRGYSPIPWRNFLTTTGMVRTDLQHQTVDRVWTWWAFCRYGSTPIVSRRFACVAHTSERRLINPQRQVVTQCRAALSARITSAGSGKGIRTPEVTNFFVYPNLRIYDPRFQQ